jgi:hypothetical protein
MQSDPISEWQRLTAHYRELSDDELRELAAEFNDLTETSQQALCSEMQSRGLGDRQAASPVPLASNTPVASNVPPAMTASTIGADAAYETSAPIHDWGVNALGFLGRPPELVPDSPDAVSEDDGPVDYTWKTVLCDCDTSEQAQELSTALLQAGIESWVQQAREFGRRYPRVLVAADQLDRARVIASRPIPPEIVEENETKIPDFEPPACPKCGAADPVLEGVDPANSWFCEQCGQRWTDPTPN